MVFMIWSTRHNKFGQRTHTLIIISGGQLKAKNGQKYVVNQYRTAEGFYVGRSCAFIYIIAFIVMMILTAVLTYLIFVPR